ncbi:transcriptional regulator with XRE-family HTH domain [Rhizobium azooxidifex]|uniref:Transcriptional regulator with XRE-family HTH domain n=1 Tax=Mycoplana azooxidifex TaxID=1636188 RepID=A0A7W6DBY8_9HYPH|nr:transcriptional regulator with XRE-family HTH domain [Mycoplana azooxidifex]
MGLLNIIRRMALREKLSIREISRRTGLSRNTIAKYLSAGTIEPTFTVPERPSKLDPFADKLASWLKTEAGRAHSTHPARTAVCMLWHHHTSETPYWQTARGFSEVCGCGAS